MLCKDLKINEYGCNLKTIKNKILHYYLIEK